MNTRSNQTPELTSGIHRIDTGASNAYLIVDDAGLALVDTGLPGSGKKILALIGALGRRPEEITRILLTHQHPDHIGGAADLVAASGAEVWAHPLDTPAIEGTGKRDGPKGPLGMVFNMLIFPRLRTVKVAHPLNDGETLPVLAGEGGLRVVATPGHTRGHISLYLAARKLLFAGDVLRHSGEKIVPSPAMFNRDQAQALRSFADLTRLEIEASLPGHGAPIMRGAGARLAQAAGALTSAQP
ncbi:MAG TPA: MBL fold metallo-hydrolase [Ktedonobacterales bacterium]|jgi:glyoxylase-like metal-dependent hydrolase (beta-lactamase superfamily II)|nr:MBL fold metallo-hydrolase [Ktedonobacterales bacterium]